MVVEVFGYGNGGKLSPFLSISTKPLREFSACGCCDSRHILTREGHCQGVNFVVRMAGYFGTDYFARTAEMLMSSASDEEIAYQLQLLYLPRDSLQRFAVPNLYQAPSSSRQACASSSTRTGEARYSGSLAATEEEEIFLSALGINLVAPVLQMECGICTELLPHTSFISTKDCAHKYCTDCCKRHAEVKILSGSSQIECPDQNCRQNYDIQQCKDLLSQSSFDILNIRQTEAAIPASQKVYCPFPKCSAFMEKSESSSSATDTFVECYSCHRGFCLECNIPWHADKTCGEYRADVLNSKQSGDQKLRDLAKKEKWQICPQCKRVVELKDGCNHITCLCKNEFCYVCGAQWRNKLATCTCKLWDERRIINQRPRVAFRF